MNRCADMTLENSFKGDCRASKKHGKGVMKYANGDQYTGDWIEDKKEGHGIFLWSDGRKYEKKHLIVLGDIYHTSNCYISNSVM